MGAPPSRARAFQGWVGWLMPRWGVRSSAGRLRAGSRVCASPAAATTLPGMVTADEKKAAARAAREAAQNEAIDAYVEELLAKAPPLTARQRLDSRRC